MKKVITLVAAIMLLVTSTLALAGCGGTKTLEEYVNSDSDVQQELSDLESSLGNGGSITVKENNIKLIYKYDQTFDEATATAMKSTPCVLVCLWSGTRIMCVYGCSMS